MRSICRSQRRASLASTILTLSPSALRAERWHCNTTVLLHDFHAHHNNIIIPTDCSYPLSVHKCHACCGLSLLYTSSVHRCHGCCGCVGGARVFERHAFKRCMQNINLPTLIFLTKCSNVKLARKGLLACKVTTSGILSASRKTSAVLLSPSGRLHVRDADYGVSEMQSPQGSTGRRPSMSPL